MIVKCKILCKNYVKYLIDESFERLRLSRGSVPAFSTQVRGFKPGRRAKKSSARLPSEVK